MILVVLALVWVAILTPMVVRRIRDNMTDRSIQSFHTEHEVLSRQEYAVAPAHRLDRPDELEVRSRIDQQRPRLTVVHDDDTYQSLESRGSWQEWEQDYEFDEFAETRQAEPRNRYAAAYSSVPRGQSVREEYVTPVQRQRSMKNRRRVMLARQAATAVVLSLASYFVGSSI